MNIAVRGPHHVEYYPIVEQAIIAVSEHLMADKLDSLEELKEEIKELKKLIKKVSQSIS